MNNWIGLFAPAGTPPDIVRRWNAEVMRVMQSPEIQARLPNEGARFTPNTPEQFARVREERDREVGAGGQGVGRARRLKLNGAGDSRLDCA